MGHKLSGWLVVTAIGAGLLVVGASVTSGSGPAGGPAAGPAGGAGTAPGGNPGAAGPGGGGALGGTGISGGSVGIGGTGPSGGGVVTGPGATGNPSNYNTGSMPGMGLSPQEAPSGQFPQPRSQFGTGRPLPLGPGSRRGGGAGMGRGKGATPPSGDANPAETLLRDMNGTNNGRRSGHAALRPPWQYRKAPLSSDPLSLTPARVEERAVYFKHRGAYEDMIYRPLRGSYERQTSRTVGSPSADRSAAVTRSGTRR